MSSTKFRNVGLVAAGVLAGVAISLGVTAVAQRPGPLPLDELRQFSSVFAIIKNNYVEPVEDRKLLNGAIAGMVSDLDPHSAYLDADAFREMQTVTQGEFGGLGIEVGTRDGFVSVISPIEDTPAARAGVRAGDLIIKIDETATQGMPLQDAVKLMRGKPQTPIVLTIMREGEPKPIVVTLMRDVIKVRSVRSKVVAPGTAYVRVSQFQEKTGEDLARHLTELGKGGAPKALVLDLRNDPGGLLNAAIGVSGAFLPPGAEVVSTKGRTPDSNQQYTATPADYLRGGPDYLANLPAWVKTVPMVVLVNGGSASASEIVAGALQDHGRAKVLGTRTFGKGSVQVILPISRETAIKLTTSRYYTPQGRSIQATGIEPDYLVTETAKGDLYERPREADLVRHLSNDQDRPEIKSSLSVQQGAARELPKPIEFGSPEDYQLQQALNLLQGRPVAQSAAAAQPQPGTELAEGANAKPPAEAGTRQRQGQSPAQTVPPEKTPGTTPVQPRPQQ
ncbi:S41 family peptidase [Achromobacter sp. GG226]|uniref:S41 family peptidase n=1 Tax=Verticiella alkaliphila TaxID=2779529 RepID=UPI001C0AC2D6|nr:S41 family peptidase [Verticiella sp. GG226]MBU4613112.1 S41 family peptidase [Verticiella sp. GG226]